MGNAKSLRGGTLLMTPLKGADGQVYAVAQGNVLVGGVGAEGGGVGGADGDEGRRGGDGVIDVDVVAGDVGVGERQRDHQAAGMSLPAA